VRSEIPLGEKIPPIFPLLERENEKGDLERKKI
jgi:hypothetical protein